MHTLVHFECSRLFALLVFAMSQPVFAEDSFGDSDSSVEGRLEESRELFALSGAEDVRRDEVDLTPRFVNVPRSTPVVKSVTRRLFSESIPPPSHTSTPDPITSSHLAAVGHSEGVDTHNLILQELRKANSRLDDFAGQLKSLDSRLVFVETNVTMSSSSTSTDRSAGSCRGKRKVPAKISVILHVPACFPPYLINITILLPSLPPALCSRCL